MTRYYLIMKLIIVESPNKIKKIKKYAGEGYEVIASVGHFREMVREGKWNLGINVETDFEHNYVNLKEKQKVCKNILFKAREASEILIATDPDREGELIAWHINELIKSVNKPKSRIVFNAITKSEIQNAINNPRGLDHNLIEAAKAREGIDKMIGFMLSPIVSKSVDNAKSVGRVQTPTLGLVLERKKEQENFVPKTTYSIKIEHEESSGQKIKFNLGKIKKDERNDIKFSNYRTDDIEEAKNKIIEIQEYTDSFHLLKPMEEIVNSRPPLVFDTAELLIESSRKLKYENDKTMKILNNLFAGGYITYPRTDLREVLDDNFILELENFIEDKFNVKIKHRKHHKKDKMAQEAHEAIRPTDIKLENLDEMSKEENDVYKLIRDRTIISFLPDYVEKQTIYIYYQDDSPNVFKGVVKECVDQGYKAYVGEETPEKKQYFLPKDFKLKNPSQVVLDESTTKLPKNLSDALIIKLMKQNGIGRPSTYASITKIIKDRKYVETHKGEIHITKLGEEVMEFMSTNLNRYVDIQFTAQLELLLDQIASGKTNGKEVERKFFVALEKRVEELGINPKKEIELNKTGKDCKLCGAPIVIKKGKFGEFESCSNYPKCKGEQKPKPKVEVVKGLICPECKKESMVSRKSKAGNEFFGCSNYPKCKGVIFEEK